ncbi:hypothetical protein GCM10018954_016650 [Kutzneria kofuensis]
MLIAGDDRWADGTRFTAKAFTYSSRKWAHLDGEDTLVIRGSVGKAGEVAALQVDDEDLIRGVRADLAELTGITVAPIDATVTRWGGGLPQYGVGHLSRVAAIETAVAELPGLAVAGASLHGVGVPACIATSQAAAARVAAHLLGRHRGAGGTMGYGPLELQRGERHHPLHHVVGVPRRTRTARRGPRAGGGRGPGGVQRHGRRPPARWRCTPARRRRAGWRRRRPAPGNSATAVSMAATG